MPNLITIKIKRLDFFIFCFLVFVTLFRFFVPTLLGLWYYSHATYDDVLMIEYSVLENHFRYPNYRSLLKTMSFPLFLNFVHFSGLSLSIVITLIWVFAALVIVYLFKQFTDNRYFLAFTYLFILFTPIAFDLSVGTRIYRNTIMPPFYFILFGLILIVPFMLIKNILPLKKSLVLNVLLATIFLFTYYINESGLWLLPCLLLSVIVSMIATIFWYSKGKERIRKMLVIALFFLLIPLIVFKLGTEFYQRVNYRFFGASEITTRTSGELGTFVNNIYRIQSDNRNASIWAPYDAIEKAFEASIALQSVPQLKEAIFYTPLFEGDIRETPIEGDFLTWVLRDALVETNMWTSEREMCDFFALVNNELREAFDDGRLDIDDRLQINSAAGGRTKEEIWELRHPVLHAHKDFFVLDSYIPGGRLTNDFRFRPSELTRFITNTSMAENDATILAMRTNAIDSGNRIVALIFDIYSVLNPTLGITALLGFILTVVLLTKRSSRKYLNLFILLTALSFILIATLYAFAIGWFAEFIWENRTYDLDYLIIRRGEVMKFYGTGIIPLMSLAVLLGSFLLFDGVKDVIQKRKRL